MDESVDRLMKCGFTEQNAWQICSKFSKENDRQGMEEYIRFTEMIFDDRHEWPKEV